METCRQYVVINSSYHDSVEGADVVAGSTNGRNLRVQELTLSVYPKELGILGMDTRLFMCAFLPLFQMLIAEINIPSG
jgi:hypothetical protein